MNTIMKVINRAFETWYCCSKSLLKKEECSESSFDNRYDRIDVTWSARIRVSTSDLTFKVQFLMYLSESSRCFRNISLNFYKSRVLILFILSFSVWLYYLKVCSNSLSPLNSLFKNQFLKSSNSVISLFSKNYFDVRIQQ